MLAENIPGLGGLVQVNAGLYVSPDLPGGHTAKETIGSSTCYPREKNNNSSVGFALMLVTLQNDLIFSDLLKKSKSGFC